MAEDSRNDDNLSEDMAQAHAELKRLDPNAHSNLAPATAGLSEADTIAIINRKIEAAQREIEATQEENKPKISVTKDTRTIENEVLLNQKIREDTERDASFDDINFLSLDHQIEDLNNEIADLKAEQTALTQKLDTIDQNIDALWTRLESEGKTEELEILGDRAAGKPLVVVNATLEGGAEDQGYVVYEDESGERYIKNPQDQSPVYIKDLNDPQINQDIADQRDRFGQEFGNENPELAARFEGAETKYQAHPTLRDELESAIRNQETGEIEQFSSYVRQDEISGELADKQTQLTALEEQQQIAATDVTGNDTPRPESPYEISDRQQEINDLAGSFNGPVNEDEIRLAAESAGVSPDALRAKLEEYEAEGTNNIEIKDAPSVNPEQELTSKITPEPEPQPEEQQPTYNPSILGMKI